MSKEWYCVQTNPRQEHLAVMHLGNRGFTVMFPQYTHPRTNHQCPLFPGYLFSSFDVEKTNWKLIFTTPGVKHLFMRTQGIPLPIPQHLIDNIEQQIQDSQWRASELPDVRVGDKVRILDGPFASFEGVCSMTATKRIEVMITIFGHLSEVNFNPNSVVRVENA
jgi:transcription antitermination factor NusG